jgi:hypothetical protein
MSKLKTINAEGDLIETETVEVVTSRATLKARLKALRATKANIVAQIDELVELLDREFTP